MMELLVVVSGPLGTCTSIHKSNIMNFVVEAIDVGAVSLKQLLIYASLVSLRNLTWPAIELVETNTKVLRHGLARCSDTQDQLYTKDNAFVGKCLGNSPYSRY